MIEHAIRVDWQVGGVIRVGVVYADDDQPSNKSAEQDVDGDAEGEVVLLVAEDQLKRTEIMVDRDVQPIGGLLSLETFQDFHLAAGQMGDRLVAD